MFYVPALYAAAVRVAVWVLLSLETLAIVAAVFGAAKSDSDAAGRGMAQAYAAIGVVLGVLLLVPALVLQLHHHSGVALGLCIAMVLPVVIAAAA